MRVPGLFRWHPAKPEQTRQKSEGVEEPLHPQPMQINLDELSGEPPAPDDRHRRLLPLIAVA